MGPPVPVSKRWSSWHSTIFLQLSAQEATRVDGADGLLVTMVDALGEGERMTPMCSLTRDVELS